MIVFKATFNIHLKNKSMKNKRKLNERLLAVILLIIGGVSIAIYTNGFLI